MGGFVFEADVRHRAKAGGAGAGAGDGRCGRCGRGRDCGGVVLRHWAAGM